MDVLDRVFGSAYANCRAVIVDAATGSPLRIYGSANGGILSERGECRLTAQGRVTAYVSSTRSLRIRVFDASGSLLLEDDSTDAYSTSVPAGSTISLSPTPAQRGALALAGAGGGLVIADSAGVMYGPDGLPLSGGSETALIGNLTSTSTVAALRADQGPAITALISEKYTKPATGIPATDLDAATQAAISAPSPSMTGATTGTAGAAGLVPTPAAGDQAKFLTGAGAWAAIAGGGLVSKSFAVTANSVSGVVIVSGFGSQSDIDATTVVLSADGGTLTVTPSGTVMLHSIAYHCSTGQNTTTNIFFKWAAVGGGTSVDNMPIPALLHYNDTGAIETQTNITIGYSAGQTTITKAGLTASAAAKFVCRVWG